MKSVCEKRDASDAVVAADGVAGVPAPPPGVEFGDGDVNDTDIGVDGDCDGVDEPMKNDETALIIDDMRPSLLPGPPTPPPATIDIVEKPGPNSCNACTCCSVSMPLKKLIGPN
jgi:hypothetical protein